MACSPEYPTGWGGKSGSTINQVSEVMTLEYELVLRSLKEILQNDEIFY